MKRIQIKGWKILGPMMNDNIYIYLLEITEALSKQCQKPLIEIGCGITKVYKDSGEEVWRFHCCMRLKTTPVWYRAMFFLMLQFIFFSYSNNLFCLNICHPSSSSSLLGPLDPTICKPNILEILTLKICFFLLNFSPMFP